MIAPMALAARRGADPQLFGPAIRAFSIPDLRAIAENPVRMPSERVAARTELGRRLREAEELAGPAVLAERLLQKISAGRRLTWRERMLAEQFDLVWPRESEAVRIEPLRPRYAHRSGR